MRTATGLSRRAQPVFDPKIIPQPPPELFKREAERVMREHVRSRRYREGARMIETLKRGSTLLSLVAKCLPVFIEYALRRNAWEQFARDLRPVRRALAVQLRQAKAWRRSDLANPNRAAAERKAWMDWEDGLIELTENALRSYKDAYRKSERGRPESREALDDLVALSALLYQTFFVPARVPSYRPVAQLLSLPDLGYELKPHQVKRISDRVLGEIATGGGAARYPATAAVCKALSSYLALLRLARAKKVRLVRDGSWLVAVPVA